jgi:hypothetical protein
MLTLGNVGVFNANLKTMSFTRFERDIRSKCHKPENYEGKIFLMYVKTNLDYDKSKFRFKSKHKTRKSKIRT